MLTKESKTQGEITSRIKEWEGTEVILNLNLNFSKNVNVIHLLFQKYLLSIYYVLNTILATKDMAENKRGKDSFLNGAYI